MLHDCFVSGIRNDRIRIRIWAWPKYGFVNKPCACCDFRVKAYQETVKWKDFRKCATSLRNKRPNLPVSLTWFLPYIFLYQSMIKGCNMPNINAFRREIHGKKDAYINLFTNFSPLKAWSFIYLNKLESPCPKDAPCQISMHSGFRPVVHKRIFLKIYQNFLILPLIGPQNRPVPLIEQLWIPITHACFLPSLVEIGLLVLEKKIF